MYIGDNMKKGNKTEKIKRTTTSFRLTPEALRRVRALHGYLDVDMSQVIELGSLALLKELSKKKKISLSNGASSMLEGFLNKGLEELGAKEKLEMELTQVKEELEKTKQELEDITKKYNASIDRYNRVIRSR